MRAWPAPLACAAALAALLGGCGPEEEPEAPAAESWENKKPLIVVASPGAMAVGESLVILGQDFIDKEHGKVRIHIKGAFFNSEGETNAVDYSATPTVVSSGKLQWKMWPDIVFDRTGDHLGRLVGQLIVVNQASDGTQQLSDAFPLAIDIKPSILPRFVQPLNAGCGSLVADTLEEQPMSLVAEVVGLRPGSKDAPLTFHWTFMAEHWKVTFTYGTLDPSSIAEKKGAIALEDEVTSGRVSSISDGGDRNFLLKVGSDLIGSTRLKQLRTGTIPDGANNITATVNVAAVDPSGKQAMLAIPVTIHRKADMVYDGSLDVISERFTPQMVTDCIPGGDIGRDVNYHEGSSESRARSMAFSWNVSVGVNISPIPNAPYALGINFSAGFGVNVNEQVSSDKSKSLALSGHILPGEYGTFYRQTTKKHRIARLVGYTECGQSYDLGQAILTDWMFTPDLATGASCPPPTALPRPEKFD